MKFEIVVEKMPGGVKGAMGRIRRMPFTGPKSNRDGKKLTQQSSLGLNPSSPPPTEIDDSRRTLDRTRQRLEKKLLGLDKQRADLDAKLLSLDGN